MAQPRSPFHFRRISLAILAIATLWPSSGQAQEKTRLPLLQEGPQTPEIKDKQREELARLEVYRKLLEGYRVGDEKLWNDLADFWQALEGRGVNATDAFTQGVPLAIGPISQMALFDIALATLARNDREVGIRHMDTVQRWVDQSLALKSDDAAIVERQRRYAREWYLAAIWLRFARSEGPQAAKLLERARVRFPEDPEILLSSGTYEAMEITRDRIERGGGKWRADRDPQTNSYGLSASQVQVLRASGYFREAIRLDPNNGEARLRLAWLRFTTRSLDFSGELTLLKEARALVSTPPMSYLAALFSARIEEELKHLDAASIWYRTAIADCPRAQTARLGLSHIQLDQNLRDSARNTLRPLTGAPPKEDVICEPGPWRIYEFGQAWRLTDWIDAMRKEVREPFEGSQP